MIIYQEKRYKVRNEISSSMFLTNISMSFFYVIIIIIMMMMMMMMMMIIINTRYPEILASSQIRSQRNVLQSCSFLAWRCVILKILNYLGEWSSH